jgi:hypothetical protein
MYLVHVWHQVVGYANWMLANFTRWVCAHWVEVAEQQDAPVLVRVRDIAADANTISLVGQNTVAIQQDVAIRYKCPPVTH